MIEQITLVTAIIGAASGLLGTVLGFMNAMRQTQRDQVKLKVTPLMAESLSPIKTSENYNPLMSAFCVEVVNLSEFPVTIASIGLLKNDDSRSAILPELRPEEELPKRLESRTSYSGYIQLPKVGVAAFLDVDKVYAKTACGHTATGDSHALRGLVRRANEEPANDSKYCKR